MNYTSSYSEEVRLTDGTRLLLRAIRPSDKTGLAAAFANLSRASRRARFHAAKTELSDSDLRFLTECDGQNHYAIVAVANNESTGEPIGVGVSRFVRSQADPSVADLAITVADDWQGRGLGSMLLRRIVAAAGERGIVSIHADVLAENRKVPDLLRHNARDLSFQNKDGLLVVNYPIASAAAPNHL